MKRYILTGAPGSGKTSILQFLKNLGYAVVEEAATDIIGLKQAQGIDQPWLYPDFIDAIIALQRQRLDTRIEGELQFHDRSVIDASILGKFLGHAISKEADALVQTLIKDGIYQRKVFFIESLDFIETTEARRMSLADAIAFGQLHEQIYSSLGFQCIRIPAGQWLKESRKYCI